MNSTTNGPIATFSPSSTIVQWDLWRAQLAEPTRLGQSGRKTRHIDGRAQVRPEFSKGADVVLMRVGDDDADQILLCLLDKAQIRHDEIDAGHLLARKGDAKVNHQPLASVRRPITVKGAIHADLAQAAERGEHELIAVCHLGSAFRPVGNRQDRWRKGARVRQEPQVGCLDGVQPMLGAHEQAAGGIDPLEHALALPGAVLDRDPLRPNRPRNRATRRECGQTLLRRARRRAPRQTAERGSRTIPRDSPLARLPASDMRSRSQDPSAHGRNSRQPRPRRRPARSPTPIAFDEDSGAFRAARHQIVRPFEADFGRANDPSRRAPGRRPRRNRSARRPQADKDRS